MKSKSYLVVLFISVVFYLSGCSRDSNQNFVNQRFYVAVLSGNGAGEVSVVETLEALKIDDDIIGEPISAVEIQNGELSKYDALIIPGGSGSKQLLNIGETGEKIIRDFVLNQGKGIVGICAGAYMLSSTPGYPNLKLASSVHIDRAHYNRGRGLIEFELNESGMAVFPELKGHNLFIQYYDGPVLVQSDSIAGTYTELGKYVTDIHPDNFAPSGITPGKTFLLNQEIEKGRIFLVAGHPESTPGMRWMVPRMVRWVCRKEQIQYDNKWIRPEINDRAIIFDSDLRKKEKENYWLLFDENSKEQIKAMNTLLSYRSRPAVRWNIGLLRSTHKETRMLAAQLIMETEYSAALEDLEQAYKIETDTEVRKVIQKAVDFFMNSEGKN